MPAKRPHPDAAFVAELLERVQPLADVTARSMFGGHGLYVGSAMFGLVAYGVLYLKVDEGNLESFQRAGYEPFIFETKDGRRTAMSYHEFPVDELEDPEFARPWFEGALAAAQRAAAARKPRAKKSSS